MLDRKQVALVAGVVLAGSLSVLYGIFVPSFADGVVTEEAFLLAAAAWVVGYAYCGGVEWGRASTHAKAIMGGSWLLLIGMEFTAYVPDQVAAYSPWAGFLAVGIHLVSYGIATIDL